MKRLIAMSISERTLEENEAKIDNILHKVLIAVHHVADIMHSLEDPMISNNPLEIEERTDRVGILLETIKNLIILADEIDIEDEKLTYALETKITQELDKAIGAIQDASRLFNEKKDLHSEFQGAKRI